MIPGARCADCSYSVLEPGDEGATPVDLYCRRFPPIHQGIFVGAVLVSPEYWCGEFRVALGTRRGPHQR